MTRVRPVETDDRLATTVLRTIGDATAGLGDAGSTLVAVADTVLGGVAVAGLLGRTDDHWQLRVTPGQIAPDVVSSLIAHAAAEGGGAMEWFVPAATDAHRALAQHAGLSPSRTLFQMRGPLPLDRHADVVTRTYEPEKDRQAWVDANNRAFAWHPDQSDMTLEDVRALEAEDWFEAEGFLLHEVDGRLAAFCWTKVHLAEDPPLGEIYVIAVDPAFQGRGLGRSLTLAGLDHLAALGLETGMLYVESDNDAAVGLYRDLGFTVHQEDIFFTGSLPAS